MTDGDRAAATPDRAGAEAPLILTLGMDDASTEWFAALRRRWFPPERNLVPAHLTLFHHLPGPRLETVLAELAEACAAQGPATLQVTGVWSLGRGVAYRLRSPEMEAFRASLAEAFGPWLTPQDRQAFRPHVTVQNKVEPATAKALLEELQHDFQPFGVVGEGVAVWRYLGGPWEAVDRIGFSA